MLVALVVMFLLFLPASTLTADVAKYQDANGNVIFTNKSPHEMAAEGYVPFDKKLKTREEIETEARLAAKKRAEDEVLFRAQQKLAEEAERRNAELKLAEEAEFRKSQEKRAEEQRIAATNRLAAEQARAAKLDNAIKHKSFLAFAMFACWAAVALLAFWLKRRLNPEPKTWKAVMITLSIASIAALGTCVNLTGLTEEEVRRDQLLQREEVMRERQEIINERINEASQKAFGR